jgi:methylmalonyl-CoA/ethylmalonyl-CoA epimerase
MTIQRLDHVVFAVNEMDGALADWQRALGLAAGPPYHPDGTRMQLALIAAGNAFLELVRPTAPEHRVAKFLEERGEGMFSISLEVDGLDAAVEQLRAKGVTVSDPEPGVFPGTRVARIPRERAHGVAVQLIERPPGAA